MKTKIFMIFAVGCLAFLFTSCETENDLGVGGTTGGGLSGTQTVVKKDALIHESDKAVENNAPDDSLDK